MCLLLTASLAAQDQESLRALIQKRGHRLTDKEFAKVTAVRSWTELDLSNKGLGVDGGLILAALMADNNSTQYLNVFGNKIPEDVLGAIMNSNESIRTFGNAEKLDFSGSKV